MLIFDETYEQLTDSEWERVAELIRSCAAPGPVGSGRRRKELRPTVNAVLHTVAMGKAFNSLGSAIGGYPSPPTAKRFYALLQGAEALPEIARLLADTRPRLAAQVESYTRAKTRQGRKIQPEQSRATMGSWGLNLSPLPWGKPLSGKA